MRAKLPHTEGYVDRDGVKLHYEIYGDGDRTMVFVPGWAIVHSRIYKAQLPYFSDHFRVIAFDPRGNGKSDRPRSTLYGLSIGGQIASIVAANFPERVEALVCVSGRCPPGAR